MNYRFNRQGEDLGVFPLEELRRRRQAGELTGTEYVWTEGMPEWKFLDAMLQTPPPLIPTAMPAKKSSHTWIWAAVAVAGVIFFACLVVGAVFALRIVKQQVARQQGWLMRGTGTNDPVAMASQPVVTTTNTRTEIDARNQAKKFRHRQWVEGYQQRGQRNQPCDAEAAQFLESWLEQTYGAPKAAQLPAVGLLADKLAAETGCDDPLVLTIAAAESSELHEKARRLERALKGFEHSAHRAYPKFYATAMLADESNDNLSRHAELDGLALQRFKEMFGDGSILPEDQAEIGEILVHGWGYNFIYRNRAAVYAALPADKSFEWLRQVLEGEYHVNEAWRARGNGYANTVSQKGWQDFARELAQARRCFTRAFDLRPDLPLAPCCMMTVALGESSLSEMRKWFDRTVALQIDYPKAWVELRWGLRPRWYGNMNAMLALGSTALDTRRFDTDVPRKLYDSISDMELDMALPPGEHIYGREDVWPLLQRMYEGYIAEPSELTRRDGWRSTYTAVAYLAGKYDVARQQLEAMHWHPQSNSLTGWGVEMSLLPQEVAARTGDAGEEIDRAESKRDNGNLKLALELYEKLNQGTNTDEQTREFIHARMASLKLELRMKTGEWVNFLPTEKDDPNWVFLAGTARLLPDGALEVESDKNGHYLYSRARIPTDFEVKGEFEVVKSSTADFQAGLIMGLPEWSAYNWLAFRMKRNDEEGQRASFSQGFSKRQRSRSINLNRDRNSFTFQFKSGKVSATVNGKDVFKNIDPPAEIRVPEGGFLLGLGAYNDMNETVIRYRNVQYRQLTQSK